jgi:DNA-binding response OmpR family regulator
VLATHLTRAGYRVTTARDGWEALHATLQAAPSLVLLDLGLPRLNGYGLLEELRSREHTRSVPVLVVTGNPSLDVDDRVVPFDVAGILLKPVEAGRLVARVRHLLEPA